MLGRAASCCDLLRLSPTPGDSSEDDDPLDTHTSFVLRFRIIYEYIYFLFFTMNSLPEDLYEIFLSILIL